MMCLGWSTQPDCQARQNQTVLAPTDATAGLITAQTGSINQDIGSSLWFWIAAGVLGVAALTK